MAIVYINVEYAKTRDEEKVSSSENDNTTKNTTKVSDEEMIINMIQDNPQITGEEGADKILDYYRASKGAFLCIQKNKKILHYGYIIKQSL